MADTLAGETSFHNLSIYIYVFMSQELLVLGISKNCPKMVCIQCEVLHHLSPHFNFCN